MLQHPSLWTELDLSNWQNPAPAFEVLKGTEGAREALRTVNLEFTVGIDDGNLETLSHYPLVTVNLNGCQKLTDSGVARFIKACPTLQELSLYWNLNVGLQTLGALSTSCTGLTSLNLSGCKSVTDAGIIQLAAACTALRQLDLTRCVKLGDAAYAAIAQHCTQLQELRLYASMPSARAVLGFSALKQLQLVDICGAHQVTGMPHYKEAIAALAAGGCLQHVNLTWCIQLTDAAVIALAKGSPNLQLLSLHGIRGITDAAVDTLAQHNNIDSSYERPIEPS
ncbi:hypothetical protein CVIRNUC_006006 [Coccomyxa viridis]|uniref:F-box/LRR-repeat protein 15-like leucin rich repeat domain-containing protein n=1 Tax=Coccomyxa viridis TaxID=1274662 RepID=A0AAV1I7R6_9CHLO|nr:hypothetical protein CVIRNUC_006006 [Coccomyxa viridis]